jgi:hypothetical protein
VNEKEKSYIFKFPALAFHCFSRALQMLALFTLFYMQISL